MNRMFAAVTAALLVGSAITNAAEAPGLKEGLWSIRNQSVDNPGNRKTDFTSTLCRSHAYDQYARNLAKNMRGCMVLNENMRGSVYTIEMRCTLASSVIQSKTTTSFQGNSTHSETHTTYTPALEGVAETTMMQDQKYVGSCPVGAQPGDMTHTDGTVQHLWKH